MDKMGPLDVRQGYETVFDNDSMVVLHIPGRQEDCIISFTRVGLSLGGIDLQSPEFSRSYGDETKLFVIYKRRSWGNDIGWEKLDGILNPLTRRAHITTLGNSMGEFLAILSASRLGAARAISFTRQWFIDPNIVPEEKRWSDYISRIPNIRFHDLTDAFEGPTQFSVFFGNNLPDRLHLRFFSEQGGNLDIIVLEDCGHNAARFLKENGQLYPAIKACRTGGDVRHLLKQTNVRLITT